MDLVAVRPLVFGTVLTDVDACRAELEALRTVRGWADAREVEVLRRLDELAADQPSVFPEEELAKASKTSLAKATRVRSRKTACDDVPELGDALAKGDTTGDRVDAFAKATSGLSPAALARVAAHGDVIAAAASNASQRQFRELIERIIGQAKDDDGLGELARQRAATRLRWWTGADGMWNLSGRFDMVRGTELEGRIRAMIDTLHHGASSNVPDDAPRDPVERQDHLAALALLALSEGRGGSGVPEVTVLIDERTLVSGCRHEGSVVDAGLGRFGLPVETVRRWACLGSVAPVIVGADGVRLFLGRETRVANRAQRRALRAWYRTCAMCDVPFEHTQVHHVSWYTRDRGMTDIDNLLPLCSRHHHLVHEGGWHITLAPDRTLTITRPDGHITTTGPPTIRAA